MTQGHKKITQEMIDRSRSRIGKLFMPKEPYFNTQASRDSIVHFCDGIGDKNPLYRDREYAKKSVLGGLTTPPEWLYSVYWEAGMGGLMPGIHAWHSGNDWRWYRRIWEGDEIHYEVMLTDVVEKKSQLAGRIFIAYGMTTYKNQRDEIVSRVLGWSVIVERGAAHGSTKYKDIEKASYTPEETKQIYEAYDKEEIRGATPRYWEDVEVGEELPHVVKGPLSPRDMEAWTMGAGSPYMKAHGLFLDYWRRHPDVMMYDSTAGKYDVGELVHMEDSRAQEIGIPGAYDYGHQRIAWLAHLLTNWIGDSGFLWKLYAELRLFNVLGDTTFCRGKVTRKYVDDSKHCVDIECQGVNQREAVSMPGRATVILPTKETGQIVYPEPTDAEIKEWTEGKI